VPKGPRTLPERTVDAWVAAYLAAVFPGILLWAPTQKSSPDLDYAAETGAKSFVLEDKGTYAISSRPTEHFVEINRRQLHNYCAHVSLREKTFYVLPAPPYAPNAIRNGIPPSVSRARSAGHPWGGKPFERWAYVVPVLSLWDYMMAPPRPFGGPTYGPKDPLPAALRGYETIPCDGFVRFGPLAWPTLQRFVARVRECRYGRVLDEEALWSDEKIVISDRAIAAIVPRSALKRR
jgi:hypothetical protein